MKIKILSILEKIKDLFELGKWIIMIVLAVSTFTGFKSCSNQKHAKDNMIGILTSEVEQIKTESGKNATQAENWQLKYKSLNKYTNELKSDYDGKISRFKQELTEANKTIKDLKIRQKNVQNYIKNELISKDSIRTELVFFDCDNIEIKPIKKKHIQLDFIQDGKFLDVKYKYSASVKTVISRYPELKANGKKHFPNWGFLYGWDYRTTSTIDDPNANISNLVSVEFDK